MFPAPVMAILSSSSGGDFGPLLQGLRLGGARYLLKRLVGKGEFSELWLARDVKYEKDVALKFMPRAFLQDENLLEHLRQEIRRNGLLQHPHIVSGNEMVSDDNVAAIAMEFVDGWSLATMKVDKLGHCYTVEEITPWIRDVCDALTHAHNEFGMVHGDLRPSNLLSSTREGIKVTDFGFAVLIRNESSKRGIIKSGYSGIGFLSPQQVMGEAPAKLDDIYSLGATIFDLLTGTPPFYKGEIIAQICSLKPPTMTQRLAELKFQSEPIAPVWEATVAACLAKNPANRPQSVEEVRQMLEGKPLLKISDDDDEPKAVPPVLEPAPARGSTAPAEAPPILEPRPVAETPAVASEQTVVVPPALESRPVSPSNSKWIAVGFACVVALFLIAVLTAGLWVSKHFQIFHIANIVSGDGKVYWSSSTVSLDKSFNTGTGTDGTIRCLALQPDGKILIGGMFTNFNGAEARKIVRLNTDGSIDTTFKPDVSGNVYAIAVQSDGGILIGGQGVRPKRPARRFIRLQPDGSRDTQFQGEGTYNADVRAITIQPDGAILVGGSFTKISNQEHDGLVRLSSDDDVDGFFNVSSDGSAVVLSMAVQPDGKILAAGIFNNFGNNPGETYLVRLNPDGSFDSGFDNAAYADKDIRTVLEQKDGKILVCGYLSDTNDSPTSYLTRLNPDGSPDTTFHFASKAGDAFWSMVLQPDGKIIAAGYSAINRQIYPMLVRLNPDGSPDGSFQITDATGGCIWSVAVQPDGKILAGGVISSMDGTPCGNIVRLQN
jgi:uncharacterized delta-60 repeat protein